MVSAIIQGVVVDLTAPETIAVTAVVRTKAELEARLGEPQPKAAGSVDDSKSCLYRFFVPADAVVAKRNAPTTASNA